MQSDPSPNEHRMVAKVDELMRWSDALEKPGSPPRPTATHLLDATLHPMINRAA